MQLFIQLIKNGRPWKLKTEPWMKIPAIFPSWLGWLSLGVLYQRKAVWAASSCPPVAPATTLFLWMGIGPTIWTACWKRPRAPSQLILLHDRPKQGGRCCHSWTLLFQSTKPKLQLADSISCTTKTPSAFSPKRTSKNGLSSEFSEFSAWLAKAHQKQTQFAAGSGDLCGHKGYAFMKLTTAYNDP